MKEKTILDMITKNPNYLKDVKFHSFALLSIVDNKVIIDDSLLTVFDLEDIIIVTRDILDFINNHIELYPLDAKVGSLILASAFEYYKVDICITMSPSKARDVTIDFNTLRYAFK